jgi:pre-mRNA-splicing factor ATP-dependent RNA helicase DHX16
MASNNTDGRFEGRMNRKRDAKEIVETAEPNDNGRHVRRKFDDHSHVNNAESQNQSNSTVNNGNISTLEDQDYHSRFPLLLPPPDDDDDNVVEEPESVNDHPFPKTDTRADRIKLERERLPIFAFRQTLLDALREHQIIIVVGETGSGKTTQVAQYLYEAGYCKGGKRIGCTQPRRVAAMSVAARVSYEMGRKLGTLCGYSIRFEDCTTDQTRIKFMTDGMLLRDFLNEPDLASYSAIIIDEAHERSLHTDILLGLCKELCAYRSDMRVIISSATLEADKFSAFFGGAPSFHIPGRRFPVQVKYAVEPEPDYVVAAVVTALQIHISQPPVDPEEKLLGDVLVFLTGQDEIEKAEEMLKERLRALGSHVPEVIVCPIYAALPSDQQQKIFSPTPPGARKIVLATNIAETSLTIEGIVFVVDCGFAKVNFYNAKSGVESLQVVPISRANAEQRAGRAGRTRAGICYRLYTASSFLNEMDEASVPEIQRSNLSSVVLMLKSLGVDDILHFPFLDAPSPSSLSVALEQLYALGALSDKGELTRTGQHMSELPLDPQLAKMMLASGHLGVSDEAATCAAMLSVGNAVFYRPRGREEQADTAKAAFLDDKSGGDHLLLVNVFRAWEQSGFSAQFCYEHFVQLRSMKRARDIREQLLALMGRVGIQRSSNPADSTALRKAICSGYFFHTAVLGKGGAYRLLKLGSTVFLHPSSIIAQEPARCVVYHELLLTSKEYMRQVCPVEPMWLHELAPHYLSAEDVEKLLLKKMPKHR